MNQVLLYSINPEHLAIILNGHKTIEVRKSDLPKWAKDKLARGEKVVGYGYCTKKKPYLINHPYHSYMLIDDKSFDILNGLVVVKFEVSGVEKLEYHKKNDVLMWDENYYYERDLVYYNLECMLDDMRLKREQVLDYGNGADLYAHHLTNITPIEPMGLGELQTRYLIEETLKWHGEFEYVYQPLTKAPQSFMTCWVKGE